MQFPSAFFRFLAEKDTAGRGKRRNVRAGVRSLLPDGRRSVQTVLMRPRKRIRDAMRKLRKKMWGGVVILSYPFIISLFYFFIIVSGFLTGFVGFSDIPVMIFVTGLSAFLTYRYHFRYGPVPVFERHRSDIFIRAATVCRRYEIVPSLTTIL